jgi:hypothetical protein
MLAAGEKRKEKEELRRQVEENTARNDRMREKKTYF